MITIDNFIKGFPIKFKADQKSLDKITDEIKTRQELISKFSDALSDDQIDTLKEEIGLLEKKSKLQAAMTELSGDKASKGQLRRLRQLSKEEDDEEEKPKLMTRISEKYDQITGKYLNTSVFGSNFTKQTQQFGNILSGFSKGFTEGVKGIFDSFIQSMWNILEEGKEVAQDLLNSSRISNAGTRQTMFQWGTTEAGAYGIQSAMDIMGFQSQEDLWNANAEEQRMFWDTQNEFAEKYLKMEEDGTFSKMLKDQVEMAKFTKEIELEKAQYYMDNRETIMKIEKFTLKIEESIVKIFEWIENGPIGRFFDKFTGGSGSGSLVDTNRSTTSDYLQRQAMTTNNTQTMNVKVDNSFNNQSASAQSTFEDSMSQFLNVMYTAIT